MAILLTNEYKLIDKVVLQSTPYVNELRLYAKFVSQSAERYVTTYSRKLVYYRSAGSVTIGSGTAEINSTSKTLSYVKCSAGETILIEEEKELTHNEDGTIDEKNLNYSITASIGGSGSSSEQIELLDYPQIEVVEVEAKESSVKVSKFANKGQTTTNVGWRITTDSTYNEYERIDGEMDHTFTNLLPNTTYYVRVKIDTNKYSIISRWLSFTTGKNTTIRLRINDNWKESIPYIYKNGWKEAVPYINVDGTYKEVN